MPEKIIESIHCSTLKSVLADIVRDAKSDDPSVVANFIVDKFFCSLGREGKICNRTGYFEFYSKFAAIDMPYEMGRRLFILEGDMNEKMPK